MIQGTSLDAVRTMEFFTLTSNINNYLTAEDLPALKLDEMHTTVYLPAFKSFDEALQPYRKTGHTQTLLNLDAERDAALVGVGKIARAFADFPEPGKAEAAALLLKILGKYGKSPQTLGLTQETGVVINLLQDLDEPAAKTAADTIGATPWVELLRDTNNRFENTFRQRTQEESALETGRTKAARKVMQEALTQTCHLINALALVNGKEPYARLIDNIDLEIGRAKQIARQRSSAKAAREAKQQEPEG